MIRQSVISVNNWLCQRRRVGPVEPEQVLLLLPHCLQWSECPQNIVGNISRCRRCGKCPLRALLELADKYGVRRAVASGGRQAAQWVRSEHTRAVVAVACRKELFSGILATLPKPVIAVENDQPCGFCHDTTVQIEKVESALAHFLGTDQDQTPDRVELEDESSRDASR